MNSTDSVNAGVFGSSDAPTRTIDRCDIDAVQCSQSTLMT
jgi:hypothetical protein